MDRTVIKLSDDERPVISLPQADERWQDFPQGSVALQGMCLEFGQSWQSDLEESFRPGEVRLAWRNTELLFEADLEDVDVHTNAKKRNDVLYTLGDTLELFCGIAGEEPYIEYHFAPGGILLQLDWPKNIRLLDVKAAGGLKAFMVEREDVRFVCAFTKNGWSVRGAYNTSSLGVESSLSGRVLEVNFGRYDYTRGVEQPIISGTSPFTQKSFHCREEWKQFRCVK